ncbi:MAG: glycosyltransferase, partial [Acidimicrobiia bacterium]|nr:glycosyltransferase [Acidimicrobiia bacterium]
AMRRVASASIAVSPLRDLPNYRHSVPTKVIEYLAVGVPVVASDLPATREVTRGLEAVHFHTPGDVSSLAACLSAISDADRAAAGAQAGEVRRRYSWPAGALLEVYDAVGGR